MSADPRTLADRLRSMVRDPDAVGTHYDECWQWHDDCALLLAAARLSAAELDEYPTFMDLMEMQERLAPLADYLDALRFDHDAELVRRMLFPTGTVADLRAERDDLAARLNTARFVADNWRAHMVAADQPVAIAAHPLCMVLAALDGETDPEQLGLDPEDAPALTAAVQPPDPKEAT
jgi:hypothetical protein